MWRILRQKEGAGVFFNGHTHIDSIAGQDNWTFVELSACLDQQAFRVVELDDQVLRITALDLPAQDFADHTAVIYEHIRHFQHNPEARGTEDNRACVISLRAATPSP